MDAAYFSVERTNVIYAVSLSLAGQRRRSSGSPGWSLHGCGSSVHERTKTTHLLSASYKPTPVPRKLTFKYNTMCNFVSVSFFVSAYIIFTSRVRVRVSVRSV